MNSSRPSSRDRRGDDGSTAQTSEMAAQRFTGGQNRPARWIGPVVSVVAMAVSIGILIYTLTSRSSEAPDFVRLGPIAVGPVPDYLDAAGTRLPARAAAHLHAETVSNHGREVTARLLGARAIPTQVHYTVARGGTLEDVANLFGIYHHEITELNPGIGLREELAPDTRVVVYRAGTGGADSESIGRPSNGELDGGVPMVEGPGRRLRPNRLKLWGTAETVARLDWVLRQWHARYPQHHDILVGNLSRRSGGKVRPHRTHQSGRDVDLSYIQLWDGVSDIHWRKMGAHNLDAAGNWLLLQLLAETEALEVIFIDYSIQKLLYEHALNEGLLTEEELGRWMQFPDGKSARDRIIRHAPGHVDHIHVRFRCSESDSRCREDD